MGGTPATAASGAVTGLMLNPPPGLLTSFDRPPSSGGGGGGGGGHPPITPSTSTHNLLDRQMSVESGVSGGSTGTLMSFDVGSWSVDNVSEWLGSVGLKNASKHFVENGIDGYLLERLTEGDLHQELEIGSNLTRVKVYRAIENLKRMSSSQGTQTHTNTSHGGCGVGSDGGSDGMQWRQLGSGNPNSDRGGGSLGSPAGSSGLMSGKFPHVLLPSNAADPFDRDTDTETDLSWLQFVDERARFMALVGWLLTKVVEVNAARHDSPGPTLNLYTHAALGALANMSSSRSQSQSRPQSRGLCLSSNPLRSRGGGSNLNSINSHNSSRGSGHAGSRRLREVLESTPGWDVGNMTFLQQPDVPWLQTRLAVLNNELKTSEAEWAALGAAGVGVGGAGVGSGVAGAGPEVEAGAAACPLESDKSPPSQMVSLAPAPLRLGKSFHSGPLPTLSPMHGGLAEPLSPFSPSLAASTFQGANGGGAEVARRGVGGGTGSSRLKNNSGGGGMTGDGGDGGGDGVPSSGSEGDGGEDGNATGFESDMRKALEAATAARDLVALRYSMTKEVAATAIGRMATPVTMTSESKLLEQPKAGCQLAAVKKAVKAAEKEHNDAVELKEASRAAGGQANVVSDASAAATATQVNITQMQDAVMHQQRASMQEMHMAAAERESVAMQEFETATNETEKKGAKSMVQKAVMQQQELAVQEMQQSVMQQQQELASEVMMQHEQDAAEQHVLHQTHENMQTAMMSQQAAVKNAVHLHEEAMDEMLQQQEKIEAAMDSGVTDVIQTEKKEYKLAIKRQKSAMKTVRHMQDSMESVMNQQHTLQKALGMQKQMQDKSKAQRAKGVAKAQVDIQGKQVEVMRQAAAIQAAVPDTPEGRDMSASEAARGYQGVDARAAGPGPGSAMSTGPTLTTQGSGSDSSFPSFSNRSGSESETVSRGGASVSAASKGKTTEQRAATLELSEEWEIDFSEIEFSPNGVPSSDNRIGHGGFGEVFLGQLGGMHVAVKKLFNQEHAEQGMREFRAEVTILSKLRHPSIVLWLGACTKAPNCTIVLEFMDRGSLHQMLHRSNTPYTKLMAIKWCISIARGMLYLHQHKPYPIIHCDLNSNNVLVNRDWAVKITDFGLSKVKRTSRLSRRSGITGTVNYAAPEVGETQTRGHPTPFHNTPLRPYTLTPYTP